ncbi:MAG TPA: cation diffusion facilitator family transporter [Calditrichia bacterium]|nr:cation transporter [Calditrichota bacterium]HQU73804.1 cation diffusion facilitator family transporter [Calditrichia bacterium]HQV32250.1 cation diffusion facilitator family transporter [Calditrichia bacterium]
MSQHHQHHGHASATPGNIRTAFFLNLAFTVIEIFGGIFTNSVAILSDALHDLGDSISLGLAWYLDSFSRKKGSTRFSYGYRRFSLLGAMVNALVLLAGSLFILSEAIPRILHPENASAPGMIGFAVLGIMVNGAAVFRLKNDRSMNARVVAWHLLEDVLGWLAVLVVGITLLFVQAPILDPLLSVLITLYVAYNVVKNLKKTLELFLQAAPEGLNIAGLEKKLLEIDKVHSTHHTHLWSLDGEHHVLSTHLVIDRAATREDLMAVRRSSRELFSGHEFEHVTIEIEFEDEDCLMRKNP